MAQHSLKTILAKIGYHAFAWDGKQDPENGKRHFKTCKVCGLTIKSSIHKAPAVPEAPPPIVQVPPEFLTFVNEVKAFRAVVVKLATECMGLRDEVQELSKVMRSFGDAARGKPDPSRGWKTTALPDAEDAGRKLDLDP